MSAGNPSQQECRAAPCSVRAICRASAAVVRKTWRYFAVNPSGGGRGDAGVRLMTAPVTAGIRLPAAGPCGATFSGTMWNNGAINTAPSSVHEACRGQHAAAEPLLGRGRKR